MPEARNGFKLKQVIHIKAQLDRPKPPQRYHIQMVPCPFIQIQLYLHVVRCMDHLAVDVTHRHVETVFLKKCIFRFVIYLLTSAVYLERDALLGSQVLSV